MLKIGQIVVNWSLARHVPHIYLKAIGEMLTRGEVC